MADQSFLPIIDLPKKIIRGLVAITPTNFAGTETTFAIGGVNYPIVKHVPEKSNIRKQTPDFMAISLSYLDNAKTMYKGIPGFIPIDAVMPMEEWRTSIVLDKYEYLGQILYGLTYGWDNNVQVGYVPPVVSTPGAALTWEASAPFDNQPTCTFFDFNWVDTFKVSNPNEDPSFIVVGSNTSGGRLAAVVVTAGQQVVNRINYNTIRIVKLPGAVLTSGSSYTFNFVIHDTEANQTAVTLTLTVV